MKLEIKSEFPFQVTMTQTRDDGMMTGTHFPSVKHVKVDAGAGGLDILDAQAAPEDTLAQWLYERYAGSRFAWDDVRDVDRDRWQLEAAEVRKAVARGGMPNVGDWLDGLKDLGPLASGEIARAGE